MDGLLIVNKENNCTSRDVVNEVGRILGTKKIGHTGTLDPMATGVLVLCIGKCTKLVDVITCDEKEYVASVILGISTDTLDITGNVLKKENVNFSKEQIEWALSSMMGFYLQEVPIYSAIKVNGKKLYEYARKGEKVSLPKRQVFIKKISLVGDVDCNDCLVSFSFKCLVSKGTYIRSLIRDIALKLGTVGVMSSLERTKQGCFSIDSSYSIGDIRSGNFNIISIKDYLSFMHTIYVDDVMREDILNGKLLDNIYGADQVLFVYNDFVLAIYKVYDKDKTKIKPYKMFGGIKWF